MVCGCALDSGSLTMDTEIVRITKIVTVYWRGGADNGTRLCPGQWLPHHGHRDCPLYIHCYSLQARGSRKWYAAVPWTVALLTMDTEIVRITYIVTLYRRGGAENGTRLCPGQWLAHHGHGDCPHYIHCYSIQVRGSR
jgi:hypothetical protein